MVGYLKRNWIGVAIVLALIFAIYTSHSDASARASYNCNVQRQGRIEGNKRAKLANDMRALVLRFEVAGKVITAEDQLLINRVKSEFARPLKLPHC